MPGNEFADLRMIAEAGGISQAQFNIDCNDPNLYFMQNITLNRSHLGEQFFGMASMEIAKNTKKYIELADSIVKQFIDEIMN